VLRNNKFITIFSHTDTSIRLAWNFCYEQTSNPYQNLPRLSRFSQPIRWKKRRVENGCGD